jgi:hypothetical protein
MKRIVVMSLLALIAGCTSRQIDQLRADEQSAEMVYTATTQATAVARETLAAGSPTAPGRAEAAKVVASAEKGEQTARLALDVARAALAAAQKQDPADPALRDSLALAIGAIPSPWTPVLASLLPATIPLVFSIVQSVKLGRAHQTVTAVTQQLEQHKAALEALTAKPTV